MRHLSATLCLTIAVLLGEVLVTSHLKVGASNLSDGIGVNDDGTNPLRMEDPKKTIILIYTHGSGPARKPDPCRLNGSKPTIGTPRVISNLDGKQINGNKIMLHRFCTPSRTGQPIRSAYNSNYYSEIKVMKRRDDLLDLAKKYLNAGVLKDNIVLTGTSAGGFASLLAQAENPASIGMVISFVPAFAGKRINRNYKDEEVDSIIKSIIGDAEGMNALVFSNDNDPYDRPADLLVWKKNKGIKIEPIHENSIEGEQCSLRPHALVFDDCFFNKKRNLIKKFIKQNSFVHETRSDNRETSSLNEKENIVALERKLKYFKERKLISDQIKELKNKIKLYQKKLETLKQEFETGN